jgi:hypothetical protein
MQKYPHIAWNREIFNSFTKAWYLSLSWARSSLDHALPTDLFRTYLNIIHPFTPRSSKWTISFRFPHQETVCIPHSYHISRQFHSSWFSYPNNIRSGMQVIKLTMQFSTVPSYLVLPIPLILRTFDILQEYARITPFSSMVSLVVGP